MMSDDLMAVGFGGAAGEVTSGGFGAVGGVCSLFSAFGAGSIGGIFGAVVDSCVFVATAFDGVTDATTTLAATLCVAR